MTLATDVAKIGIYDGTDISNMITEALDQISLFAGTTIAENDSEDWDRIVKYYAVYLLDRMSLQKKSLNDPSINVPSLMSDDVLVMINKMELEPVSESTKLISQTTSPRSRGLSPY